MAGVDPHSILSLLYPSPSVPGQDMDEDDPAAGGGTQSPNSEMEQAAEPSIPDLAVQAPLALDQGQSAIDTREYYCPLSRFAF